MTPKEKADDLCGKMLYQIEWNAQPSTVKGVAKQCALICVEEIISNREKVHLPNKIYWQMVKQELQKIDTN